MNTELESQLNSKLKTITNNDDFLRGAILMAFACLGKSQPQRAESFAFEVATYIVNKILCISANHSEIIESKAVDQLTDKILDISFRLADEGLLEQLFVEHDACPYLQQRVAVSGTLIEEFKDKLAKHREMFESNMSSEDFDPAKESDHIMLITSFWTNEIRHLLKCRSVYFQNEGVSVNIVITRYENGEEFRYRQTLPLNIFGDNTYRLLASVINGFKEMYPALSYND